MNANILLRAASLLAMMPILGIAQVRRNPDPVVLKHWPAPLYWQRQAADATSSLSANLLVYVAMTPCRVVDTRASQGFPAGFGAPSLAPGVSRTFAFGSSTACPVPPLAQAYSLNITVVPQGLVGFFTAYPTGQPLPLAATLVWSQGSITSNAAVVPSGLNGSVDVYANSPTDVVIDINGYYTPGSDSLFNTALGPQALVNNTSGYNNVAYGSGAMFSNTTGVQNTAIGGGALGSITTANVNTALGYGALDQLKTGDSNIGIGPQAGFNLSAGASNIYIGSRGASSESYATRIGDFQRLFFATGIHGVTTGSNNAVPVVIDSNGQLGTVSSSRRFKEDIQDMGEASRALLRLRPVTFRYQKPFDDGSKPIQYGLVAEEVAEVFPDLVARSADGQIETVKYQVLDSLLLNEVQRQQGEIGFQTDQILGLKEQINELKAAISRFEMMLAPK